MNYRIEYNGTNSTIKFTRREVDEVTVFSTFNTAKQMLLLYLREQRNDYNDAIVRIRALRIGNVEVEQE